MITANPAVAEFIVRTSNLAKPCRMCGKLTMWTSGALVYNQCCQDCRNIYHNFLSPNMQKFYNDHPAYGKKPSQREFRNNPWKVMYKFIEDLLAFGFDEIQVEKQMDRFAMLVEYQKSFPPNSMYRLKI